MWDQLFERGVSGAPQIVEWLAVFAGLLIATVLGRLNLLKGKAGTGGQDYQLAGAVVDRETANAIVAALRSNSRALSSLSSHVEKNTEAANAAAATIDEARQDIRELTRELIRSKT
jgi:hypothetical protein